MKVFIVLPLSGLGERPREEQEGGIKGGQRETSVILLKTDFWGLSGSIRVYVIFLNDFCIQILTLVYVFRIY